MIDINIRLTFFSIIIFFNSCKNDPSLVSELFEEKEFPIEIIEQSKLIHTENGLIKIEINANKIERFMDDSPRLLFSEGFEVIFYDNSANIISNLKAENAVVDDINKIMKAFFLPKNLRKQKNINKVKGRKLNKKS